MIDDETLQAVRNLWQAVPGLPTVVSQLIKTGRLKSPQALPYAQHDCKINKREPINTGGVWWDVRTVTMKIFGLKSQVVQALGLIQETFNRQTILNYPSGETFFMWWPSKDATLQQDEKTYQGQDLWIGTIEAEVTSIRKG